MAATVTWYNSMTGTPAWQSSAAFGGVLYFHTSDSNASDFTNPLVKPSSGNAYSFEKACKLVVTGISGGQLSSLQVLIGGTVPTNTSILAAWDDLYKAPQLANTVGAYVSSSSTVLSTTPTNWLDEGIATADITANTDPWGDFIWLAMQVASTATAGSYSGFQVIARYNEI